MVASRTLIQHKQYQLPVTIGYLRKSDSSEQEHGADATMCLISLCLCGWVKTTHAFRASSIRATYGLPLVWSESDSVPGLLRWAVRRLAYPASSSAYDGFPRPSSLDMNIVTCADELFQQFIGFIWNSVQDLLDALDAVLLLTQSSAPGSDCLVMAGFKVLTWRDPDTFASLHNLLADAVKTTSVWAGLFLLLSYPHSSMRDEEDHFYPALFTLEECSLTSGSISPLCMPGRGLDGVACHCLALTEAFDGEGSSADVAAAKATALADSRRGKRRYESPAEPSQPGPDGHPPKSSLEQHETSPHVKKRLKTGATDHGAVLVPNSSNSEDAGRVGFLLPPSSLPRGLDFGRAAEEFEGISMTGLFNLSMGHRPQDTTDLHLTQDVARQLPPVVMTSQQRAEENAIFAEDAEEKRREFNARGGFAAEYDRSIRAQHNEQSSPRGDLDGASSPWDTIQASSGTASVEDVESPQLVIDGLPSTALSDRSDGSSLEGKPFWCDRCQRRNSDCNHKSCHLLRTKEDLATRKMQTE